MTAYDRDLAYIHDTGFTGFARKAAPGLLRLLRQNRVPRGLVVDAGCGSGVWARELTDRGYEVLGIDISVDMIRLARRQATASKFQAGSFLSAALPPCDAVTSIGECLNYAFDRRSAKRGLAGVFRRVHGALRPGGVFVFDIVEPGVAAEGKPQRRFLEGPDWAILLARSARGPETEDAHAADRKLPAYGEALQAQRRDTSFAFVLRFRVTRGTKPGRFRGALARRVRTISIPAGARGFPGAEAGCGKNALIKSEGCEACVPIFVGQTSRTRSSHTAWTPAAGPES